MERCHGLENPEFIINSTWEISVTFINLVGLPCYIIIITYQGVGRHIYSGLGDTGLSFYER